MAETYLHGRITITSLAAPTQEDVAKIRALSSEDRRTMLNEALERGEQSGLSSKSIEDIWEEAKQQAKATKQKPDYAV